MAHRFSKETHEAAAVPQTGRVDPARTDIDDKPRKRRRKPRNRPDPRPDLVEVGKAKLRRIRSRHIPPIVILEPARYDEEHWTSDHNDTDLSFIQLCNAFGTRGYAVVYTFLDQLQALVGQKWWDEEAHQWRVDENVFNAAIAMVDSLKPKNEIEAAFAAQMVAVHLLTMKVSARAIKYEWDTKTVAAASKLARTFTLQMEELRQMRGRKRTTRQNITVTRETSQHVHYHDHRGEGPKVSVNLMQRKSREPSRLQKSPRCQARTRAGKSCRSPAVRGKRVCRMHGGKSPGAPKGERNGNWKHGGETLEAVALRREASRLLRMIADGQPC